MKEHSSEVVSIIQVFKKFWRIQNLHAAAEISRESIRLGCSIRMREGEGQSEGGLGDLGV